MATIILCVIVLAYDCDIYPVDDTV